LQAAEYRGAENISWKIDLFVSLQMIGYYATLLVEPMTSASNFLAALKSSSALLRISLP
jgi:hypothetical protein